MLHAAKFRIYPTAAQETFLWAQWGAVRKCWNMALFLKKHYYRTRGVSLNLIHEIKPLIARAKKSKKYAWLREYDSMALQESVRNLNPKSRRKPSRKLFRNEFSNKNSVKLTDFFVDFNSVRMI